MAEFIAGSGSSDAELRWKTRRRWTTTALNTAQVGFELRVACSELTTETPNPEPGTTWSKVGFVRAQELHHRPRNTPTLIETYRGRYAYRIKQIDNNRAFRYTDAVEVEVASHRRNSR